MKCVTGFNCNMIVVRYLQVIGFLEVCIIDHSVGHKVKMDLFLLYSFYGLL